MIVNITLKLLHNKTVGVFPGRKKLKNSILETKRNVQEFMMQIKNKN